MLFYHHPLDVSVHTQKEFIPTQRRTAPGQLKAAAMESVPKQSPIDLDLGSTTQDPRRQVDKTPGTSIHGRCLGREPTTMQLQ